MLKCGISFPRLGQKTCILKSCISYEGFSLWWNVEISIYDWPNFFSELIFSKEIINKCVDCSFFTTIKNYFKKLGLMYENKMNTNSK